MGVVCSDCTEGRGTGASKLGKEKKSLGLSRSRIAWCFWMTHPCGCSCNKNDSKQDGESYLEWGAGITSAGGGGADSSLKSCLCSGL